MTPLPKSAHSRRRFLRALGCASAAATAVTAPLLEAEAYDPGQKETATRYRETEHVRAFYRTNGYEGAGK
jgi:hypothetical protein